MGSGLLEKRPNLYLLEVTHPATLPNWAQLIWVGPPGNRILEQRAFGKDKVIHFLDHLIQGLPAPAVVIFLCPAPIFMVGRGLPFPRPYFHWEWRQRLYICKVH
jgi:hypothetical protein